MKGKKCGTLRARFIKGPEGPKRPEEPKGELVISKTLSAASATFALSA